MMVLKKIFVLPVITAFVAVGMIACDSAVKEEVGDLPSVYDGVEFDMPKVEEPAFPDYSVSITEFGAIGDGQFLNTEAFASAIAHVAKKGGGEVIVPQGIWLTGPITLKSNINLHTESGALVVFSRNKDLYPLVETSFEGLNTVRCMSPINGAELENIAITGMGVFDGSGDAWRHVKRSKMTKNQWTDLVKSGGVLNEKGDIWMPSEAYKRGMESSGMNVPENFENIEDYKTIKDFLRPVMVSIIKSNKVLLEGPTFQNSPAWNIHPLMCENLTVRNIEVRNPWYSQNGDGIDIESCKNVVLTKSRFDVGDDAICIKSGKNEDGRKRGIPSENLIIKNCVVYHGHGGVTVGSEMSGGVKNMHVSGCTFIGTDVGLRFKSTRGRGGVVEGVYISDVDMIDIPTNAISFNLYYGGLSVSEMLDQNEGSDTSEEVFEVTEETPQFKDIYMKNITCRGAYQAIYLQGLPEMNLENVNLENMKMVAENGLVCVDADGVNIKNLDLKTSKPPAMMFYNSKNVDVDNLTILKSGAQEIVIDGTHSKNISIEVQSPSSLKGMVKIGDNVANSSISVTEM